MYDLVIKDGVIKDGFSTYEADIAIEGERIGAIGSNLTGRKEISANGKWIIPGAVDVHTHFSLPFASAVSSDDFYTGTRAAIAGGVTTIIDFTSQQGDEGLKTSFERRLKFAEEKAVIDYSFHSCIGKFSKAVEDDLQWASDNGLTSLKIFSAYKKAGLMMDDGKIFELLEKSSKYGILITVHAESGDLIENLIEREAAKGNTGIIGHIFSRPEFTETEAVSRLITLALSANSSLYIVHLSSGKSAELVMTMKKNNPEKAGKILVETCPQYLFLDDRIFNQPNPHFFACCPPVRPAESKENIFSAIKSGAINVLATDHCPFRSEAKNTWKNDFRNIPMGLPGVETLVPLILGTAGLTGMSADRAIRLFSVNPAKIFGLYPEKGSLLPGADADIVIFDPTKKRTISATNLHMNIDYSPYEGFELTGFPDITISRGEIVYLYGRFFDQIGRGRFLRRKKFASPVLF
ncbi:MAG: dihydropyrimidinase [Candidatus Riflebacteria bacterium]|nr:dihydropyrimidinase [Candidatus Riflebacteria bacterium]